MPSSKRCIFGCVTKGQTVHSFPNPKKLPEQFKIWVELGGEQLKNLSVEEIYPRIKVCDKHFIQSHRNRNSRLSAIAVPMLHLPQLHHKSNVCGASEVLTNTIPTVDMQELSLDQDAVTGVRNDHDYCTPTNVGNDHDYCASNIGESSSIQVKEKLHVTKKKPGSSKKTLNILCYKEAIRKTKNLRREIYRLRKRCKSFKSRLEAAKKVSGSSAFQRVTCNMTLPAKVFTAMQFRETKKKPKSRRFTLEEKILALSFYKRSPKAYKLLNKNFTLPSSKSLKNLLTKIKIEPGINKVIFQKIRSTVADMTNDSRLCTLIFDEMSINPQVHYEASKDVLKVFCTLENNNKIADHVLTFMIRGIKKNYKQPVAYYFTQNLTKIELKNCLQEVIRHVMSTGLKVIATVCDQSSVNIGAIESLLQDTQASFLKQGLAWRNDMFIVGNAQIIPLYDVPHLFKGIRNNLITKDLKYIDFNDRNMEKFLKWEYFQQLYAADKCQGELKYLYKLTEEHINPSKINKMKVKSATQLFSHSVAVAAHHLTAIGELDPACRQITPIVLLLDKLFDSLNCSTFNVVNGKVFRAGVKRNSPHHKLWQDSLKFLKNIKFLEKKRDNNSGIKLIEKVVPSIKNLIKTIEGMQAIWKILLERYDFDTMLCRNFNQDPIENFFGSVRSLGVRNISPNIIGFEGAFKSLLLSNFNSPHSISSNCEQDISTYLQTVDFFIKNSDSNTNVINTIEENEPLGNIILTEELLNTGCERTVIEGIGQKTYVCGWVLKKCLKIIGNCKTCKLNVFAAEHTAAHAYIKEKEYCHQKWLCYPSMEYIKYFEDISNISGNILKRNLNPKHIKQNIKLFIDILLNNRFGCHEHKDNLNTVFQNLVINVTIYSWCRSVNRILSGKMSYDGDDVTKMYAHIYYNKHKRNKK